jgi:outer membrane receptor protein involved in Fe transport
LGGSFAYTDTELKDDAPQVAGRAGDRLPLTPKWAGSLTADYDFDLGDDTRARLGFAWRYTGARDQYFPQSPRNRRLGNYSTLNLTAGVSTGPVDINLFVRNLTNKYDFTSWLTPNGATVLQPRTIGLSVDMNFR